MRARTVRATRLAAVLALLAALVLPVLALAQDAPPARPERPGRLLARQALDLTPGQEKALAEFRRARSEERRAFREEMAKVRGEMRGLMADPEANRAKIEGLIDRTARLRAEREKAALGHRAERDRIFTPEQREKLRAFRENREARREFVRGRAMRAPGRARREAFRDRALRHRPAGPGRWIR
ncbi:MAG: periplasmic heavy metal sensor [Candidatus Aminicenantes bacterium]|nr:periplasmic heavy metal sensor [Candidatus Aminicenantes bacterium]